MSHLPFMTDQNGVNVFVRAGLGVTYQAVVKVARGDVTDSIQCHLEFALAVLDAVLPPHHDYLPVEQALWVTVPVMCRDSFFVRI